MTSNTAQTSFSEEEDVHWQIIGTASSRARGCLQGWIALPLTFNFTLPGGKMATSFSAIFFQFQLQQERVSPFSSTSRNKKKKKPWNSFCLSCLRWHNYYGERNVLYFDFGLEDVFLSLDSGMVHKSTGSMDPQMENQEMWLEEERVDEKELSTESLYVINQPSSI